MKYSLFFALLLGTQAQAMTSQEEIALKAKFSAALSIVVDSTNDVTQQATAQGAPEYPKYNSYAPLPPEGSYEVPVAAGAPAMLADYEGGKVTQQITSVVTSPAGQILSEVSSIVYEMGLGLYEGVSLPSDEAKAKVCSIVKRGFDKRRTAAFYPGYPELHSVFKNYVHQFESVSRIIECPFPY